MTERILFVDDDKNILQALKRLLHDHTDAWDMAYAAGAEEARELLGGRTFDVAVLDVLMPGKSGLELLEELKNDPRYEHMEVIMLTGLEDERLKRQALDLGAADLLTKPISKEDLLARLKSVLRVKSFRDDLKAKNAELESQLLHSQRMALVGTLAAGAVHDLRNILATMVGYTSLAADAVPTDSSAHSNLNQVFEMAERAKKLTEQMVRFCQRGGAVRTRCSLATIVDESLELLRPSLPRAIKCEWESPAEDSSIDADPTQIYQVIMNLVLNACDAIANEGAIRIQLDCAHAEHVPAIPGGVRRAETYLCLAISDTGRGVSPEVQDHLFDPLFTTKESEGGSGLGLFVVRHVVRGHDGEVIVQSEPNNGTTFTVYLPSAANVGQVE